jgi:carboxypeptidase family protein
MNPARFVSLLAIGLLYEAIAAAQIPSYVYGHVVDPSGGAVAGAGLTVVNEDSGFRYTTESQSDGSYTAAVATGDYKITVRKDGFRTMIRFHVHLEPAASARADFALSLGSVQETITVEGTSPTLSHEASAIATKLGREDIDRLPLNGRGVLGLIEMAPGANIVPATRGDAGQFVADGQRPNTNYFNLDGISANNGVAAGGLPAQASGGALPVMSAFGSLDALISLDSVQEFRLQSSSSPSSFGRLPGANISLVSRSGSDEFHGTASFGLRNETLDANDWIANRYGEPRAKSREQNAAGTFGGPLWRHRSFFFASYERIALNEPYAWLEAVPSFQAQSVAPAWAQPALDLFPSPNGAALGTGLNEWTGRGSRPAFLDTGSLRLDHAVNDRITMFGRFSDAPSTNEFGITQINHLRFRSWSGTLGLNWRAGTDTVFDIRVNQSDSSARSGWSGNSGCELLPVVTQWLSATPTCNLLVRFLIDGVGQVVSGPEGSWRQRQFQFVQSAGWRLGAHSLRLGTDYRRIVPERRDATPALSLIADDLLSLENNNIWIGRAAAHNGSEPVREVSIWAQDMWQISKHLMLTGGLRWEFSPAPKSPGLYFLDPTGTTFLTDTRPLWPAPYGHFVPRAGLAYSPGRNGRTVVRAGGGIYYDSSLSIATDAINSGPLSIDQFTSPRYSPFPSQLSYAFLPNLRLPRVAQWNASVEQVVSSHDTISLGYVGSAGDDLIRRELGGPGSSPTSWLALTTNHGASKYHALVAQYRRRLANRLEGLVSYTWSHSLDNASSDAFLVWAGGNFSDWGSSDFDVRHSLTASLSYALPGLAKGWALDGIFRARTGFPITVLDTDQYTGISFTNAFRPDLVPGLPVWVRDAGVPGGKILNPEAFVPQNAQQGNLGRNAISGFGMSQVDLALRREFRLADRRSIDLRVEAFNALNHPNFADPVKYLNSPFFGQSTSMLNMMLGTGSPGSGLAPLLENGGARSMEVVVRFHF